jgi:hypothetical protein
MFLGAALALAYIPGWTGSHVQTGWAVLSLVLPWTLWKAGPWSPFQLFGAGLLAFAGLSLFWTPDRYDGVEAFWHLMIFALAFCWAPDLRRVWIGLAIGLAASSALAILSTYGIRPVYQLTVARQSGLFYNPLVLGGISALVIVGLVTERLYWWLIPVIPGFILSGSRGAWLAVVVALTAMAAGRLRWLVPPTLLAGAACYFIFIGDANGSLRFTIWHATILDLTPLGHGIGSFAGLLMTGPDGIERPAFAHNQFLTWLYELGAAGGVLIWITLSALWRSDAKEWPVLLAAAVIAVLFDPMAQPVLGFLFVVSASRCLLAPTLDGASSPSRRCLDHMEPQPSPTR